MNIRVEATGPCRKEVHVEFPAEAVGKEFAKIVEEYAAVARIPGFRPGRAPRDLVKRRFQKEIVDELKGRLVPQGYQAAVKQEKLETVTVLDVKEQDLKEGNPFAFTIKLDVAPSFELPVYKGLAVKGEKLEIKDEDVDAVIQNIREQNVKYTDSAGRPVQAGDMVQVDFTATSEGKPLGELSEKAASLGSAKDFWLIADQENEFLPGFAAGVLGATVGEQRTIAVTFPADFTEASVAGRKADFATTIKAIREKQLPPIDAEFLKSLGVEDEAKLKERVRSDLQEMRKNNERARVEGELIKQLVAGTTLDIPESVLQEETQQAVYDMVRSNTSRGVAKDEIESNKDQLFDAASKSAAERIKVRYILRKIAAAESISATKEEIQQRIVELARRYQMPPERFEQELDKNNSLGRVADEVRLMKTVSWIYDQAKVEVA